MRRFALILVLVCALGGPARAVERAASEPARPVDEAALAALPAAPRLSGALDPGASPASLALPSSEAAEDGASAFAAGVSPAAIAAGPAPAMQAPPSGSLPAGAKPSLAGRVSSPPAANGLSGWLGGARLFDGWRGGAGSSAALGVAAAAPAAGHAALLPAAMGASYVAGTLSSVVVPLPEIHAAFRRGHAQTFPVARAALGALGCLSIGLINGVMLDKTLWGLMQTFVGLGMIAPFFIGLWLRSRGTSGPMSAAPPPDAALAPHRLLAHHVRHDGALRATLGVAAGLFAASLVVYGAASAFVPAWLAAHLSVVAIDKLLLAVQVAKALFFIAVFAPDVVALARGKPVHGFSIAFTATYLLMATAYTVWGFSSAALSLPGPLRDQYVVHGLRNLCQMAASGLSLVALLRARRSGLSSPRP